MHVKVGDGYQGWPEHAPFDKIIVTCSPGKGPAPLVEQLKEGGRMVIPVGERYQQVLYLLKKENGKLKQEILRPTLFVPMTGKAEDTRQVKPDPTRPKLNNSSFEELAGDSREPTAWYYQRQMQIIDTETAPDGKQFVRFTNETPGRQTRHDAGTRPRRPQGATRSNSRRASAPKTCASVSSATNCQPSRSFSLTRIARARPELAGPFSSEYRVDHGKENL